MCTPLKSQLLAGIQLVQLCSPSMTSFLAPALWFLDTVEGVGEKVQCILSLSHLYHLPVRNPLCKIHCDTTGLPFLLSYLIKVIFFLMDRERW